MTAWPWPVGTIVVCVDDAPPDERTAHLWPKRLVLGEYYTIRMTRSSVANGRPIVHLCEIVAGINADWGIEQGWRSSRFRPAESTHSESTSIAQKAKV